MQNVADEGKKRLFEIFTSTKVEKQDTNAVVENSVQGEVLYDVFEELEEFDWSQEFWTSVCPILYKISEVEV